VLEYIELRHCAYKHYAGVMLGKFLNMPSLLPVVLYDTKVALRTGAHWGAGLVVTLLMPDAEEDVMWEVLNVLRIDPALAMPFVKSVTAVTSASSAAFPKLFNLE
jgi:hypothetical protein